MSRVQSVSFSSLVPIEECSTFYLMAYEAKLYSLLIPPIIKNLNLEPIASWVPTGPSAIQY